MKKLNFAVGLTLILILLFQIPHCSALDVSCRAIKARDSDPPPLGYGNQNAWMLGYTGEGIVIAIIDTGVDDDHESLKGKFIAGVDFTKPFNPITNPDDGSVNPDDEYGHGTATASIAMGTGGTEKKYMGVAPDAKLIDVKEGQLVITERNKNAIQWCIDHKNTDWDGNGPGLYDGIDIIVLVGAGGTSGEDNSDGQDDWSMLVNKAVENGIVVVCVAGNWGPDNEGFYAPVAADKAITVGSVDDKNTVNRNNDEIAKSSSRGPRKDDGDDDPYDELKPDVVAPGVNIMAAKFNTENEYREASGTSFSCPHVAGVSALMLQANPDLKPTADRNPIQEILRKTAESRGTPDSNLRYGGSDSYYNKSYGWGIMDAYEAVKAALAWEPSPEPNKIPTVTIDSPKNNTKVSNTITISGTALDTDGNVSNVELKTDENSWFNISIVSANSLTWNYSWNTKDVENGMHTIYAKCYDGENWSVVQSVDVNVYNKVAAGAEQKTKINPVYLISGAGIIGAVVIIVIFVLLFRRKRLAGLPVSVPPTAPPPVSQPVPFVTAKCPTCGNIIEIRATKRPVKVVCPKCGAGSVLR